MLEDIIVRVVAFLVGIFGVINGFAKLMFPTKIREFVSKAPTYKLYVFSGLTNFVIAALLAFLAPRGKLVDVLSYAVIAVAVTVAAIGVAEIVFAPKFKKWFVSGKTTRVSTCLSLLLSLLLIYLAL